MSHHTLSYDEVTKLTDNDIDEVRFLDISAWSSLSADEQAECYAHLRNLKRQVKNQPLDADDLTQLLRKITSTSSYVSPTSSAATSPAEDDRYFDDYIQAEQRAYDDLVLDGGPVSHYPSRTFESALDKIHDPSGLGDEHDDVREIILYWLSRTGGSRYVLSEQLHTWKTFRKFQEQIRHDNSKFLDYCQRFRERRRKYNLEAVAELLPDQSQQTKLGNWEEYQNFHIIRAEELEERKQKLEEQVQEITSHYPQVAHAIQQSESENTHTLSLEQIDRQKAALDAKIQTMHQLRLCSKRYELIQSWSETETTATRANWISAARSELSTAQAVYDECVSSSKLEAERCRKRLGQFPNVWREIEVQRRKASREASHRIAVLHQEIKLAEDLLHKAQSDPVEDTFEIAYLKHILLQDLTHAEAISKLAEKELHEADLRGRLISLLADIRSIHNDTDHHSKLLKWIGKQCSDIASQAKGYGVQMSLNRRSSLRSQKHRLGHLESRKPSNRIRKRSELGDQNFQESCTLLPTALRRSKRIRRKPERYCPC